MLLHITLKTDGTVAAELVKGDIERIVIVSGKFAPRLPIGRQFPSGFFTEQGAAGRTRAGISLAEKLNISTSNLGKLERGLQGVSIDLLIEIGFFFNVSTDYLLIGHSIPHYNASKDMDAMIAQLEAMKKKL